MKEQYSMSVSQKTIFIILVIAMALTIVNNCFNLYDSAANGLRSADFLNNLEGLIVKLFYVYMGYLLYSILRYKSTRFMNLLSEEGIKMFLKLYYLILSLILFRILFHFFETILVRLPIGGKKIAYNFGYLIGNGFAKNAVQDIDLVMSLIIVWVFIIVLKESNKLKQENDLTI